MSQGTRLAPACLLALAAAGVLGLAVRLSFLRQDSTFQRTDEVMFVLNSLTLHELVAPASVGSALRELFWMFAFPWGYPVLLFTWGLLEMAQALGIAVREATVIGPFALLGAVAPLPIFFLGRRLFSPVVGLAAAAAVAVLPSHVAQSRTIGAWILASTLFIVVVLAYVRYREARARREAWLLGLALAAYLPSDNLAPGGGALLLLHALAASGGPPAARVRTCARCSGGVRSSCCPRSPWRRWSWSTSSSC